jgi:hypothetical protein
MIEGRKTLLNNLTNNCSYPFHTWKQPCEVLLRHWAASNKRQKQRKKAAKAAAAAAACEPGAADEDAMEADGGPA